MVDWRSLIRAYVVSLLTFVVLDAAWISLVALAFFRSRVGDVLAPSPVIGAVLAFYPIYVVGLVVLAVRPALVARSPLVAASHGAMLGLSAYATFDLTNLAIIARWSLDLALVDLGWGVIVSALAAVAGYAAGRVADRNTAAA